MAHFLRTDRGFINLDRVATVTRFSRDRHNIEWSFLGGDGEKLGSVTRGYGYEFDLEELTAPLIPAAPGAAAILVSIDTMDGRPTAASVWTDRVAIIAWRITEWDSAPVFIEPVCQNQRVLIEAPNGKFLAPHDTTYDTMEEAKASLLAEAQRAWDVSHPAQVVA